MLQTKKRGQGGRERHCSSVASGKAPNRIAANGYASNADPLVPVSDHARRRGCVKHNSSSHKRSKMQFIAASSLCSSQASLL